MEMLIGLGILGFLGLMVASMYNKLVRLKNMVEEGWSGVEVQLKKRADLIPNLVSTVKGYAAHEKETFENVTRMRSASMGANTVAEKGKAESGLKQALINLYAVSENYPDLKANENFLRLQSELDTLEDEIEMARRYYNGTVRENNITVESFPSNIIANMFNFSKADFFEIEDPQDREVPQVEF